MAASALDSFDSFADSARDGLDKAAAQLRSDPKQATLACIQSLRHSLRTLYACAEAGRVVVRQGNLSPPDLCQAANICLQLHEQSNSVAMKATLGRKAEAWTDVRQTLLDAARAAVQALIDHGMKSVGPLTEDLKQDLQSPHAKHRAVPRACQRLGELLDDVADQQLDTPGLRRLHMKLYCWMIDSYRSALGCFRAELLPESLKQVKEDARCLRQLFAAHEVLPLHDMLPRYELLKDSCRAAAKEAMTKPPRSRSGALNLNTHPVMQVSARCDSLHRTAPAGLTRQASVPLQPLTPKPSTPLPMSRATSWDLGGDADTQPGLFIGTKPLAVDSKTDTRSKLLLTPASSMDLPDSARPLITA